MGILNIQRAERKAAKLVIAIQGISGSGKTRTAIGFAYGLAGGDGSKVGFLDTENKRGRLYADDEMFAQIGQELGMSGPVEPFLIADLAPPFTPARYVQAIKEFQDAGVEVLIIDSVSHEWAGEGGCYDIANNTTKRTADWLTAKNEHKKFVSTMLQADMHIVPCIREAEKTDFSNPKQPRSMGFMPIQEKSFVFEMTASIQMWSEGMNQQALKIPTALRPYLGRGEGYITPADGLRVREWVSGGKQITKADRWEQRLELKARDGLAALTEAWGKTPDDIRAAIGDAGWQQLAATAQAFDESRAAAESEADQLAGSFAVDEDQPSAADNLAGSFSDTDNSHEQG